MTTSQIDNSPGWSYVLDAGTGFLMRSQFGNGDKYREWADRTVDCDADDDLFNWHGPSRAFDYRR